MRQLLIERSLAGAVLTAIVLVACRATLWWAAFDSRLLEGELSPLLAAWRPLLAGWPLLIAGWLASGGLLVHAWMLFGRRSVDSGGVARSGLPVESDRALSSKRTAFVWLAVAALDVLLWPYALDPERFTVAAFVFWGSWALFPVALAESLGSVSRGQRRAAIYLRCLKWLMLAMFVVACGVYLARSRPYIGSVDFFFAVCNARDMLADPESAALNAYRYFPGGYAFWRFVMTFGGNSLTVLQNSVVLVLIVNAVLCSAVVIRVSRSYAAGVYASVWYLVVCSRFQGLTGVMEPIATVPFLVGLLIWGGQPLQARRGLARAVGWGICLGLTVLVKQQAGLLTLGAGWLLVSRIAAPADKRHDWLPLIVLPIAALATFLVGVLSEGHGWLPLRQGLDMLSSYPGEGSWVSNLYVQLRGDESLAVVACMLVVALIGILMSRDRRARWMGAPWLEIVGFCSMAAAATIVQFRTRAYGHYMLLMLPALTVAAASLAVSTVSPYLSRGRKDVLRWGLLLLAATIPLAHTAGNSRTLHVWRLRPPSDFRPQRMWHQNPRVASDLASLKKHIEPGETLYILPPRHHSIHYLMGTRSLEPWGYGFRLPEPTTMPWDRFDGVILLTGGLDESDRRLWTPEQAAKAEQSLRRHGFEPQFQCPTFTLYRRVKRPTSVRSVRLRNIARRKARAARTLRAMHHRGV